MTVRRASLLLGTVALLTACGGSTDDKTSDRDQVDQMRDEALAAVDGVVHGVADATGVSFKSGQQSAVLCGDDLSPGGVIHDVSLHFGPLDSSVEQAVDDAAAAFEADGWDVERPVNPAIVLGESDGLTVRFHFGPAATEVKVRTPCVETSRDVAYEYQNSAATDVAWK